MAIKKPTTSTASSDSLEKQQNEQPAEDISKEDEDKSSTIGLAEEKMAEIELEAKERQLREEITRQVMEDLIKKGILGRDRERTDAHEGEPVERIYRDPRFERPRSFSEMPVVSGSSGGVIGRKDF